MCLNKWGYLEKLSGHFETDLGHLEKDLGHIETASQVAPPWLTSHLISLFVCGVYLKQTIIHKLWSDSTGVRYHQHHREIKYYVIYRTRYWLSPKNTCHVKKMDTSFTYMPRMSNSLSRCPKPQGDPVSPTFHYCFTFFLQTTLFNIVIIKEQFKIFKLRP